MSKSFSRLSSIRKNDTDFSSSAHRIKGVDTLTAFIGLTRKGPANKPTKISNFTEFENIFGGLVKEYVLGYCVR